MTNRSQYETILALDLSTYTGYAVLRKTGTAYSLFKYGLLTVPASNEKYPWNYLERANQLGHMVYALVAQYKPDAIIIEETNGSKSRYTQKLLEFLHFGVLSALAPYPYGDHVFYINTSDWRKGLGVGLSSAQKKANATLSKAKSKAKKSGRALDKKTLGIKGKVTKKHVAVEVANTIYGLNLKVGDNDMADAICLGTAFIRGVPTSDGK